MTKIRPLVGLGWGALLSLGVVTGCGASKAPDYVATAPKAEMSQSRSKSEGQASETAYVTAAYDALDKNCGSCHGEGARMNRKVPIDRASYARLFEKGLVVPDKPQESKLYTVMLDKENPMPPPQARQRPSVAEIEAIRLWIEKGAPAPKTG